MLTGLGKPPESFLESLDQFAYHRLPPPWTDEANTVMKFMAAFTPRSNAASWLIAPSRPTSIIP
jgi:hypothetical protein